VDVAARQPGCNFLGLEIRAEPFRRATEAAAAARASGAPRNCTFILANPQLTHQFWLPSYPGSIASFSILHPDPHYKSRHRKRRVLNEAWAATMAAYLAPGGAVFLQTDVAPLHADMVRVMDAAAPYFSVRELPQSSGWGECHAARAVAGNGERGSNGSARLGPGTALTGRGGQAGSSLFDTPTPRESYVRRHGGDLFYALAVRTGEPLARPRLQHAQPVVSLVAAGPPTPAAQEAPYGPCGGGVDGRSGMGVHMP
jgi:hypothetical protein